MRDIRLLITDKQTLSVWQIQWPYRILNRCSTSDQSHEPEHWRPISMREHVQQRLLHRSSVEDDTTHG